MNTVKFMLHQIINHRFFLLGCFIAALIVRGGWVYLIDAQPVSDSRWYYERGIDFAGGRGYTVGPDSFWPPNIAPASLMPKEDYPPGGRPTAYWPVGYPAFLGWLFFIFGPAVLVAKIANVFLYLGVLVFSYYIAKTLFESEITGRITVLILVFYPEHIAYTSLLSTEVLFLFLLLVGITLLIIPNRKLWLACGAGFVFGLACLVKPQAIFIPAIFGATYLVTNIRHRGFQQNLTVIIVVYISLELTILPWQIRNYKIFNNFIFISNNGGYNLLVGNNSYATGGYVFNDHLVSMLSDVQTEPERNRKAFNLAIAYMVDHPLETITLWPDKLWHLFRRDASGVVWNERGMQAISYNTATFLYYYAKLSQLYYMLIWGAFLVSLFVLSRNQKGVFHLSRRGEKLGGTAPHPPRPAALFDSFETHPDQKHKTAPKALLLLGVWVVLYFTVIYTLTFGDSRFHFPMMPWIVMYVSALAAMAINPAHQVISVFGKKTSDSGRTELYDSVTNDHQILQETHLMATKAPPTRTSKSHQKEEQCSRKQ